MYNFNFRQMKNLTEEKITEYLQLEELIEERIDEISKKVVEHSNYVIKDKWVVDKYEFGDDKTWVTIYESWPYGGHEYHSISFPKRYLWDDNYEIELIAEKEVREAKQKERAALEKKKRKAEQEKQDLAEYERLKKKYGK